MDASQTQETSFSKTSLSTSKYELQKADTTELPLANRDEQPPLVVDLPEGQKLVVGKLEEGTVIEVASWKGTGRPDSRTSRLMLGITRDEPDPEIEEVKRKFLKGNKKSRSALEDESIPMQPVSLQAGASRVQTGVNFEYVTPSSTKTLERVEAKRKKKTRRFKSFLIRNRAEGIFLIFVIALGLATTTLGGISVTHPKFGVKISMGSVKDSLVAIKRGSKVAVGDQIIISVENQPSPELVVVQGIASQSILTSVGGKYVAVKPNQVQGRVVAVFPYFGWPFNL
jgi:hypothetical protein